MNSTTNAPKTLSTTNLLARCLISILTVAFLMGMTAQVQATGAIFYALDSGEVRALDMDTGNDAGISIPAAAFVPGHPTPAIDRNFAYDPQTDLLWYAAADNDVHSVNVSTLAAGPIIDDINDATYGPDRTLTLDQYVRRLYISDSLGNVHVYELITHTRMFTIPPSAFGMSEPNPGNLRRLSADGTSNLWYAADDGTFKEFMPRQSPPYFTGRFVPLTAQVEPANAEQYRAFVAIMWPNGDHHLHYATSNGDVRTVDLATMTDLGISFFETQFWTLTNPQELRCLAIDPDWTAPGSPPAMPTGITATDGEYPDRVRVSWNTVTGADFYRLYRRNYGYTTFNAISPWSQPPHDDMVYIVPGEIYEYAVSACRNGIPPTVYCSDVSIDFDGGYAGGLTPPTGLTASQGAFNDRIRVSWDAVPGATGYMVFRVLYAGSMPTTQWVTSTTWDDMYALPQGSTWEYSVAACTDPSACSAFSGPAWGRMSSLIFADGFESGDPLDWSQVVY